MYNFSIGLAQRGYSGKYPTELQNYGKLEIFARNIFIYTNNASSIPIFNTVPTFTANVQLGYKSAVDAGANVMNFEENTAKCNGNSFDKSDAISIPLRNWRCKLCKHFFSLSAI